MKKLINNGAYNLFVGLFLFVAQNAIAGEFISEKTGLVFVWGEGEELVLGDLKEFKGLAARSINEADARQVAAKIETYLTDYQVETVKKSVEKIHLMSLLAYNHVPIGGWAYDKQFYLAVKYVGPHSQLYPIGDKSLEKLFHHEFAHVLHRVYWQNFDAENYVKGNLWNFKYGSAIENIGLGTANNKNLHPFLHAGFVSGYGTASMHEDFATVAEALWVGDAILWDKIDDYPKVKSKRDQVIDFYQKIDAKFNLEFFKAKKR